jgi:dTDP-4-dehydrorhamnose reductase
MRIGLIGANGLLGQAFYSELLRTSQEIYLITKDLDTSNLPELDIVINANGNSNKVKAENEPLFDFESNCCETLRYVLLANKLNALYVHISSEEALIGKFSLTGYLNNSTENIFGSNYTFSKNIGELLVERFAQAWLIIRPSSLIGNNLKKGPIFDILNNKPIWLTKDSTLQLMRTKTTALLALKLSNLRIDKQFNNSTFNLSAVDSVTINEVAAVLQKNVICQNEMPKKITAMDVSETLKYIDLPRSIDELRSFILNDM